MSLFVRASTLGGPQTFWRFRGLIHHIGRDGFGMLTCNSPRTTVLTLRGRGAFYAPSLSPGTNSCASLPALVTRPVSFTIDDHSFDLIPSSPAAEARAHSHNAPAVRYADYPSWNARVEVGNVWREYPLWSGVTYGVGSSDECAVCVSLGGVPEVCMSLRVEDHSVTVLPLGEWSGGWSARESVKQSTGPQAVPQSATHSATHSATQSGGSPGALTEVPSLKLCAAREFVVPGFALQGGVTIPLPPCGVHLTLTPHSQQ